MATGDNNKTVVNFAGYQSFFDNQKKKEEIPVIVAHDHMCTEAENFFTELVFGTKQEKDLIVSRLSAISEPHGKEINRINEYLCYSGFSPQRKEMIINAIIGADKGAELLENLRRNGLRV